MILGGYEVSIRDASYHVSYGDVCGAVLIHRKWALTTAHCGSEKTYIRIGSKYRLRGRKARIRRHIVHPEYGSSHVFDYDVQLLELYRKLHFNDAVSALLMSDGECGEEIYVTGWGYSREKGEYNDRLHRVKLHVVSMSQCQKFKEFWYNHTLTTGMFCAWGDGKDACQGDSGTAAVSLGMLVGLSSFGFGCGRRIPGVYTNISNVHIRKWIKHYTGI